ncbi:MAG: hypothetical protein IJP95_07505 [Bacteroidales bacterium]|nr:hypothetical protein [Bacteroidales bacterium]
MEHITPAKKSAASTQVVPYGIHNNHALRISKKRQKKHYKHKKQYPRARPFSFADYAPTLFYFAKKHRFYISFLNEKKFCKYTFFLAILQIFKLLQKKRSPS